MRLNRNTFFNECKACNYCNSNRSTSIKTNSLCLIVFIVYLPSITCTQSNIGSFKTCQFFCISTRRTTIAPTTNWVLWSGRRRWQDSRRNIVIIRKVGTLSSFVSFQLCVNLRELQTHPKMGPSPNLSQIRPDSSRFSHDFQWTNDTKMIF